MNARVFFGLWAFLFLAKAASLSAQPIVIDDFNPKVGAPGDVVTLTGSGFSTSGFTVLFWQNRTATIQYISSDTLMTVYVPNSITTGPIGIRQGTQTLYTQSSYTAIGPGPFITDFSPAYGVTNDSVTINGVHFSGATAVKFNGTNADFNVNADGTQITTYVPYRAKSGPISVTTAVGTSNSPTAFTVIGPGPYVTSFSPGKGSAGQTVYVYGKLFSSSGATNAAFNGRLGANFVLRSDTMVQVDAPVGVTTGPISVLSPLGAGISSSNFFAPPQITGFSPGNGPARTRVTIGGANFLGATAVTFNGVSANFTVDTPNQITATVPDNATSGTLIVSTPGWSAPGGNFVVLPLITGFSPWAGPVGTAVTITGANFATVTAVKFNGAAAALNSVTFNQITATVLPGATTGPISVTIPDGTTTTTTNFYLPPAIASFSPTNAAPGANITISGTNFTGVSAVNFNGMTAAFVFVNDKTITATVPPGVTSGPISVTAPAGTAFSAGSFYAPPALYSFTPTHGLPNTVVTILGANFLGASAVQFNGLASASVYIVDNGTIQAAVPRGAQTGPIAVITPGGTVTSTNSFVLDYRSNLAVSLTDSPDPVTVGSNLVYVASIWNNGPDNAPNVRVTNTLPAGLVIKSASATQGSVSINGNVVSGNLGAIPSFQAAYVTVAVIPQSMGIITDTMGAGSDYVDPDPSDNTATALTTVQPLALLSIRLLSTNQVKVSWPGMLSNYVLEGKSLLATNNFWSNITVAPILTNNENVVTEMRTGAAKYYRLRK